jgi:arylsulfatase
MHDLGILRHDYPLSPRPADVPAWDTLAEEERDVQDLVMAAYAGMIDRVDQNVGRLVGKLDAMGVLDNTLILFLSDNGACPFQRTKKATRQQLLMPWDPNSYWTYDKGWAHACNTPFREYKRNQHEGGISTPLIAHWPRGIAQPGSITREVGHLVDIMATCLDLAKTEYPKTHQGQPVGPPRGRSLVPILAGRERAPRKSLFFTFYGTHNALREGDWKLVNKDRGPWELYNLESDRTELKDLAPLEPDRLRRMQAQWEQAAGEMGVPAKPRARRKKAATRSR